MTMVSRDRILDSLLELSTRPGARTRGGLLDQLLRTAMLLAECDGASVLCGSGRRGERYAMTRARQEARPLEAPRGATEFTRILMRVSHPIVVVDQSHDVRMGEPDACPGVDAGPALYVPLRLHEQSPGYLAVFRRRGAEPFDDDAVGAVTLLAAWAAMALDNLRLGETLEKLAVTDDLTQVYNYRFLKTALRREIRRAGRYRQELSLVMIDVDNLKTYNDQHGHLRGSYLLREIAGLLASQVRSWDLVAKYGGDEFTLILPQTGREGAMAVGERMRSAIAGHVFPLAQPGQITVSLGTAVFPTDADDPNGLIQAADRALYLAKQRGRNRVETLGAQAA